MFLKKLVGMTDMEDALQRLENVTLEESRMTGAEALKAIHGVGDKVEGVEVMLQNVTNMLQGVGGKIQGVDDKVQGVDDKTQGVDDRIEDSVDKVISSAQTVQLPMSTALIIYMVRC